MKNPFPACCLTQESQTSIATSCLLSLGTIQARSNHQTAVNDLMCQKTVSHPVDFSSGSAADGGDMGDAQCLRGTIGLFF